jgi:hypothetical protein
MYRLSTDYVHINMNDVHELYIMSSPTELHYCIRKIHKSFIRTKYENTSFNFVLPFIVLKVAHIMTMSWLQ